MQSVTRVTPLANFIKFLQVMSTKDLSNSLCQVIELPVGRVIFRRKLANNGGVLVGALFKGKGDEDKIIPWEVYREI